MNESHVNLHHNTVLILSGGVVFLYQLFGIYDFHVFINALINVVLLS